MTDRPHIPSHDLVHAPEILYAERRPVRFQDIDAAGIVFFPRILEYFHDAWVSLLARRGVNLAALLREGVWGMPLGHAEADFLGPMRFGDEIVVEIVRLDFSERSLTVGFRVRSPAERVLAVGQVVHVCIDRSTFRSMPLPDEFLEAFRGVGRRGAKEA